MSSDLAGMYQEVTIGHGRHPHTFRKPRDAIRTAEGVNPPCGNGFTVDLELTGGRIGDIAFQGSGDAISQTPDSLTTAVLTGKSEEEALALFGDVHSMLTEGSDGEADQVRLGSFAARAGVSEFPMRVKCTTLAWHTLRSALDGNGAPRTRE